MILYCSLGEGVQYFEVGVRVRSGSLFAATNRHSDISFSAIYNEALSGKPITVVPGTHSAPIRYKRGEERLPPVKFGWLSQPHGNTIIIG